MERNPSYIYGPVHSRRLGKSLGVSPVPLKVCSYSCIYCQLGRTRKLTTTRQSFFPREDIHDEITRSAKATEADILTFAGDGEPTLNLDLGWLIKKARKRTGLPVAVITNGSLLWMESVRNALFHADLVLPSLDAGDDVIFRVINRPHGNLSFDSVLKGLFDFQRKYSGRLLLEIMLVHGVNDSDRSVDRISRILGQLQPDQVFVMTPLRPPAEPWVVAPPQNRLLHAQQVLGRSHLITEPESGDVDVAGFSNAEAAILGIGTRHMLRLDQAEKIETHFDQPGVIQVLIREGKLIQKEYDSVTFLMVLPEEKSADPQSMEICGPTSPDVKKVLKPDLPRDRKFTCPRSRRHKQ